MKLHQLLEAVVAIDDAAVKIVKIRRGETTAIKGHEWTQFRRNDREHIENHPFRLVAGFAETFDDTQTLGEFQLFLLGSFGLHLFANVFA